MAAFTSIDNPELYFQVKLYTGNGSTNAITFDGDIDMQPDFLWIKRRDGADNHTLFDAVRGVTKAIYSDLTNTEDTLADSLSSFDSNGFTLGADTGSTTVNENTETHVAWAWKEASGIFDIVSYTGNGSVRTISHSLSSVVPKFMMFKGRSVGNTWGVYYGDNTDAIFLDENSATSDSDTYWNDTSPTTSVFTLSSNTKVNQDTKTYIGYLFSEVQGYSSIGTYIGNGVEPNFVYTGFTPRWVLRKALQSSCNWTIFDSKRETNENDQRIKLNTNDAEAASSANAIDLVSNGFVCRGTDDDTNADGNTYIYMAFAESPLVNSNGVPCNAK